MQNVSSSLIQFIRKQTKIAHGGNGGLIISWSIILENKQIHTHRNPVSLFPPVFSPPRLIYPSLGYLQEKVDSYQLSQDKLSAENSLAENSLAENSLAENSPAVQSDEITTRDVSIRRSERRKGNHFERDTEVHGDIISADNVYNNHYYYDKSGSIPPESSEVGNDQEEKHALQ